MKATNECYSCLGRLVKQAVELATSDEALRDEALRAGNKILDEHFSPEALTIDIANRVHRAVKEITGNPDPYRRMKDGEIRLSRELSREVSPAYPQDFKGCLALSTLLALSCAGR